MPDNPGHPNESECHAFTREICKGDRAAVEFCSLWYAYCHAIDDLVDEKVDGRPTLSNEKIIQIFANAALLYNCPFFVRNREHLFPIVLMVTNQYADSVAWEKSPLAHRRTIADVLRCCGDEMFFMVAMICGGYEHMRAVSGRIRDRDWILQHDANGNPT